jgi:rRNA maturation RNase YbeY
MSAGISFLTHSVSFQLKNKSVIINWLNTIAKNEKKKLFHVQYVFCNDAEILRINKSFLKHDYYTDIITFDYSQSIDLHGEIYVSLETVQSNSNKLNVSFEEELNRVLVHGLLHLCGYKDKSKANKLLMREKEDQALLLLNKFLLKKTK